MALDRYLIVGYLYPWGLEDMLAAVWASTVFGLSLSMVQEQEPYSNNNGSGRQPIQELHWRVEGLGVYEVRQSMSNPFHIIVRPIHTWRLNRMPTPNLPCTHFKPNRYKLETYLIATLSLPLDLKGHIPKGS